MHIAHKSGKKNVFGKWLEMPATNSKPEHESTINKLTVCFMQRFRTQKLKTPPQKNSKSKKGFSANAWQRTLTHKRTSSTAMQDGSLFALVTWESRPGHLHDACRAPHGSTTRRWVMRKHQGSASLSACGTTYAGNAKPTSGSSNNPQLSRNLLDHGVDAGIDGCDRH